ncbi:unnamed protein product [Aspergillus oryzae var. brunneus]|uniref:Unnamed protein product n=1 Tax=Aspergillus oryzae var. brunneus TaxID=332754 RepID=A0ABQ6KI15_ASPOZ|nr:unnamed protein product [Aspergillus oryzae var. brunneus]
MKENSRLKEQIRTSSTPNPSPASTADIAAPPQESYHSLQNPLFGERAWFYPYDSTAPPIYMGDAACTAFATRLRQFLTEDPNTAHVARTQYTPESSLLEGEAHWPSLAQARLLVKIAFNQLSRVYHLFLRKSTLEQLESLYRLPNLRDDPALTCKFFSLFALGEVYSSRSISSPTSRVPGTRRHSAYTLIGSAMRLGLILGLNHNIPARQCTDPTELEHRVRLWWAIYIFDRIAILRHRISGIQHPFSPHHRTDRREDLYPQATPGAISPTRATIAARIAGLGSVPTSTYQITSCGDSPEARRVSPPAIQPGKILHTSTSRDVTDKIKCVILATRPILLHALFQQRAHRENHEDTPQPVITLSEACIHAARHSHTLITEEWVNGSLPMYGYFYAQYLFSSAIILVMSGLLPSIGTTADLEFLETAIEILRRMKYHGNLAAAEFYENLKRVKQCLPAGSGSISIPHDGRGYTPEKSRLSVGGAANVDQILDPNSIATVPVAGLTTEMAFLEPTMQDFLGRTNNEMDLINPGVFSIDESTGIDAWPTTFWTS